MECFFQLSLERQDFLSSTLIHISRGGDNDGDTWMINHFTSGEAGESTQLAFRINLLAHFLVCRQFRQGHYILGIAKKRIYVAKKEKVVANMRKLYLIRIFIAN